MSQQAFGAGEALPTGAVVGAGNAAPTATPSQSGDLIPAGAVVGAGAPEQTQQSSGNGSFLGNLAHGAEAGAAETATGLSHIGLKIPGTLRHASQAIGDVGADIAGSLGLASPEAVKAFHGTTVEQGQKAAEAGSDELKSDAMKSWGGKIGYGGETLIEFLLGDEALKGLSLADKLLQSSKVAKILEGSPRLMEALKAGANMSKAKSLLDPAARAAIDANPVLGRLVSAGFDAVRNGTVQFGQTGVRTGDVGEAAKEGGIAGGVTAVLGGVTGAIGGALEKGKNAADTVAEMNRIGAVSPSKQGVSDIIKGEGQEAAQRAGAPAADELAAAQKDMSAFASGAPTKEQIASDAQGMVKSADEKMHADYDSLESEATKATAGSSIDYRTSALAKAVNRYKTGIDSTVKARPLDPIIKGRIPTSKEALTKMEGLLEATKSPDPIDLNMSDLFEYRKDFAAKLRSMPYGDPDRPLYEHLLTGTDDSIGELMHTTGNPELIEKYDAAKAAYRETKGLFKNRDVQTLLEGNVNDVMSRLASGSTSLNDIETVKKVIGDQNFNQLATSHLERMTADNIDQNSGVVDYGKLLKEWGRFGGKDGAAVKDAVFGQFHTKTFADVLNRATNASGELKEVNDVVAELSTGSIDSLLRNPDKVQRLVNFVGPESAKKIGHSILESKIAEAGSELGANGEFAKGAKFDADKVLTWWEGLKDAPELREALFTPDAQTVTHYNELMRRLSDVSSVKKLVKFGILPAAGTAGVVHSPVTMMLAILGGAAGSRLGPVRDILDELANHPRMWRAWQMGGNVASNAGVKGVTAVGTKVAGQAAAGAYSPKARVYGGATGLE